MRSLPEKRFWNELRSRLKNYSEEPDEVWDAITSQLPPEKGWPRRTVRLFSVLAISALIFLGNDERLFFHAGVLSGAPVSFDPRLPADPLTACVTMDDDSGRVLTGESHFAASNKTQRGVSRRVHTNVSEKGAARKSIHRDAALIPDKSEGASGKGTSSDHDSTSVNDSETFALKDTERLSPDSVSPRQFNAADTVRVILSRKESKRKARFRPAIFAAINPSLAYYKITPNQSDDLLVTRVHQKGMMTDRFSFQFEAGLQHRIGSSLDVFAGVSYYAQEESVSYSFFGTDVEEIESTQSMSYELSPVERRSTADYSIKSVGLSAGAFYLLKDNRLSHRLGAGLQYHRGFLGFNDERGSRRSGHNQVAFMIAYRLQTSLSHKVDFFVQSSFTQFVTSYEILNGSFQIKPYRVALGVGLLYRIAGQPLKAEK